MFQICPPPRLSIGVRRKPLTLGIACAVVVGGVLALTENEAAAVNDECIAGGVLTTCVYTDFTKLFTFVVPAGVTAVDALLIGGPGGDGAGLQGETAFGAIGGTTSTTLTVNPGQQLGIWVGGPGGNPASCNAAGGSGGLSGGETTGGTGGVDCPGGGGGGGTFITDGTTLNLSSVEAAAGGGGGGGGATGNSTGGDGGQGGGRTDGPGTGGTGGPNDVGGTGGGVAGIVGGSAPVGERGGGGGGGCATPGPCTADPPPTTLGDQPGRIELSFTPPDPPNPKNPPPPKTSKPPKKKITPPGERGRFENGCPVNDPNPNTNDRRCKG